MNGTINGDYGTGGDNIDEYFTSIKGYPYELYMNSMFDQD